MKKNGIKISWITVLSLIFLIIYIIVMIEAAMVENTNDPSIDPNFKIFSIILLIPPTCYLLGMFIANLVIDLKKKNSKKLVRILLLIVPMLPLFFIAYNMLLSKI